MNAEAWLCSNTQWCILEISSHAHWYIVTSNFASVLVLKLRWFGCIWSPYCTDCHTDLLCDLQRGDGEDEGDKSCKPAHAFFLTHTHTQTFMFISLLFLTCAFIRSHAQEHRNTSTLRLTVASGDAHELKLQHKASQCGRGDMSTVWVAVPGTLTLRGDGPWVLTRINSS